MIKSGLSEYEYGHPAFIKTVNGITTIFLNIDHKKLTPGSLVHELSHLILGYIRANSSNYDAYMKMLNKIDLNNPRFRNYRQRYNNRTAIDIKEEILADLFSKYFNDYITDYVEIDKDF
jgi:hypothetical protein